MLLRLAYLGVTNVFALLRLLPRSDHNKDTEILVLRHQLTVLQRHLDGQRTQFHPTDRVLLAALPHPLPRTALRRIRLLGRPDTIPRRHRDPLPRRPPPHTPPPPPPSHDPAGAADPERCDPSALWSCGWPERTAAGATGACTASCSPSA